MTASPPGHSRAASLARKTPRPSTTKNVPNVASIRPTAGLVIVFSGTWPSGRCSATPATSMRSAAPRPAPSAAEPDVVGGQAERDHDEDDLRAFEEDAVEGDDEREPVQAGATLGARGARGGGLSAEELLLVALASMPASRQDRLAQPLQAEDQLQRTDDEHEPAVWREAPDQRGPERNGQRRQHQQREGGADQRRAPLARRADRQHDRQRLDELDAAGDRVAEDEADGV